MGFDTRSENQGIPERCSACQVKLLGAIQNGLGWQRKGQQFTELGQTVPGVRRGDTLFVQLA